VLQDLSLNRLPIRKHIDFLAFKVISRSCPGLLVHVHTIGGVVGVLWPTDGDINSIYITG